MVLAKPAKDIPVDDLLGWVREQLGKRYVFGTAGPNTFDCSGLVLRAFAQYGVKLPHSAANQATFGQGVARGDIQKGDLIFFNLGRGRNSHVGIATSPSTFIEAPNSRNPVRTTQLSAYYRRRITAVRRMGMIRQDGEMPAAPSAGGLTPNGVPNGSSATRTRGGGSGTRTQPQGTPQPRPGPGQNGPGGGGNGGATPSPSPGGGLPADAEPGDTGDGGGGVFGGLANSVRDGLEPLTNLTGIAEKITALFLPTMLTRIVCGVLGLICILSGAFLIIREGKNG